MRFVRDLASGFEPGVLFAAAALVLTVTLLFLLTLVWLAARNKIGVRARITPYLNLQVDAPVQPHRLKKSPRRKIAERSTITAGKKLREFRRKQRIRQQDLAITLNKNAAYISDVETGQRKISHEEFHQIVNALNLTKAEASTLRSLLGS